MQRIGRAAQIEGLQRGHNRDQEKEPECQQTDDVRRRLPDAATLEDLLDPGALRQRIELTELQNAHHDSFDDIANDPAK